MCHDINHNWLVFLCGGRIALTCWQVGLLYHIVREGRITACLHSMTLSVALPFCMAGPCVGTDQRVGVIFITFASQLSILSAEHFSLAFNSFQTDQLFTSISAFWLSLPAGRRLADSFFILWSSDACLSPRPRLHTMASRQFSPAATVVSWKKSTDLVEEWLWHIGGLQKRAVCEVQMLQPASSQGWMSPLWKANGSFQSQLFKNLFGKFVTYLNNVLILHFTRICHKICIPVRQLSRYQFPKLQADWIIASLPSQRMHVLYVCRIH